MVISLVVAIIIPFELFLLAYAILGPLHYLTEINWLKQNGFFIKKKNQIWALVALTFFISVPIVLAGFSIFPDAANPMKPLFTFLIRFYPTVILICLVVAIALVYEQKVFFMVILLIVTGLIIYLFRNTKMYYLLAGLLLPSLFHVYLFTLIFMAYGVIKTKNKTGFFEVLTLALMPLIITFLPINHENYTLGNKTLATFRESNFGHLNFSVGNMLGPAANQDAEAFIFSAAGIKIQIFIAFAYLYHYLNWFSKVSLIGWLRNTSGKKISLMLLIWIISLSVYFYDYRLGLGVLFFLSLLHVTLEFPLNILSAQGVFGFLTSRFRSNP
ncbi:MAG TPA: hypothetical protein VGK59_23385 [Ohtaekwangia sp.]